MPTTMIRPAATAPLPAAGRLANLARWLTDRRRAVLALAAVAVIGAALAGLGVAQHLSGGGFTPDGTPSARAGTAAAAGQALTRRIAATPS